MNVKSIGLLLVIRCKEFYLDVRNPKLYKKVKRYYVSEGLVKLSGEDPEADYEAIVECISEDLESEVVYRQTANPNATNSEFDGYR